MNHSNRALPLFLVLSLTASVLSACSNATSSNVYNTTQAGTLQEVQFGTVLAVRNIMIQQDAGETGRLAGGVIGGVAGSDLGQGKGQIVGSVAGAVAGSAIGSLIDRTVKAKPGVELTIQMKDGRNVAVAQLADEFIQVGENVKILTSNGKARVTH